MQVSTSSRGRTRTRVRAGALVAGLCVVSLWQCTHKSASSQAYVNETDAWHHKRIERLTSDTGWLTLVGLHWLTPGKNTFGSGSDNNLVFPSSLPANAGHFVLAQDGKVSVHVLPAAQAKITAKGVQVRSLDLLDDTTGAPTVLQSGTVTFYAIKRGTQFGIRVKDSASTVRSDFKGVPRFAVDDAWRLDAQFEPYDPPRAIAVASVTGGSTQEVSPGAVVFKRRGRLERLDVIGGTATEPLFIVFADRTNGSKTYGAGRFLEAAPPDAKGRVVLDFNRATNPPCAFTPYATCPLPPRQNRLGFKVEAGEMTAHEAVAQAH